MDNLTNGRLFFDYLVYEPLRGAPIDGDVLQIGNGDSNYADLSESHGHLQDENLMFSPGWDLTSSTPSRAAITPEPGAFVTVKFNGGLKPNLY
jgi:hypothetical protein